MRNNDARNGVVMPRTQNEFVDDITHDRIKASGGFVVKNDFGVEYQGPSQTNPLSHTARKFGRLLSDHGFG